MGRDADPVRSGVRAEESSDGDAGETPLPAAASSGVDSRIVDVWCTWLGELATNAEAALAAAVAYRQLVPAARDRWLAALAEDAPRVTVPAIALYAPLLAVEPDPARRERILAAMGPTDRESSRTKPRAVKGVHADGTRVSVLVTPLYLEFVQVLACGYRRGGGFAWVKHDPIVAASSAPRAGDEIASVTLEATPFRPMVDELAHVVVAHTREGRELPEALRVFADLFGPSYEPQPIA